MLKTDDPRGSIRQSQLNDAAGQDLPSIEAAEAWKVHRALRDFDHQNARTAMLANATHHFHAIALNRSVEEALQVWHDCIRLDPAFEPGAEARMLLARMAIDSGEPRAALELVTGFDKRFAGHALVPGAFAVAWEALNSVGKTDRADQVRRAMHARYPDHPLTIRLDRSITP